MNLKAPQGKEKLGTVALTVATLLVFVSLLALSLEPPAISLGDMEKRIVADKEEYFLGENVNIRFIIANPLDRDARLEPIREFTYGTTMNGENWINADVHLDYAFGAEMVVRAGANYTLFSESLTPAEPGKLEVHAFGKSLNVTVYPYKEASLLSPGVYPNILAPDKARPGEDFTAFFCIVNDNPYRVRLQACSFYVIRYGYNVEELAGQVIFTEWSSDEYIDIQPHSRYFLKTIPFSPSRQGEYYITLRVDGHEAAHTVIVEP